MVFQMAQFLEQTELVTKYKWQVHIIMSVMQRRELQELALGLAEILEIQIPENADPLEPGIIIAALAVLFPESERELEEIMQFQEFEQQWSCVLEFIQINMLDGQRLDVQSLGIEEIGEIYQMIIEYTQQALQEMEEPLQEMPKQKTKQKKEKPSAQIQKKQPNKSNQIQKKDNKKEPKTAEKKEKMVAQKPPKEQSKPKKVSKSKSNSVNKQTQKQQQKSQSKPKANKESEKPSPAKPARPAKPSKIMNSVSQPLQNQLIKQITTAMKGNQKKPKNKILMKDPKSTQQVMKAKRQFEHYLSQFKKQGNKKAKVQNKIKKSGLDQYFLKALEKRQKNIQQTVINQQLKYFLTLRDKKVAFINKIHALTQKLERQRLVQKEKEQRRLMEEQRAKTHHKIVQSNALFEKNMELLKENYKAIRQKNELQEYNQQIICKQMEQCMKKKKLSELQDLKMLWSQQNMKLNNIMGDQEKVKNKLIDIYRRNRP